MRVLGASSCGTNITRPLFKEIMAVDYAVAAAREALTQAQCDADELDIIVTFSVSPSHISHCPEIIGPRVGHALQRELKAKKAIVLDLLDCDWTFALDVVHGFFAVMGFTRALIARSECFTGLLMDGACLLEIRDGAGALVVTQMSSSLWACGYQNVSAKFQPACIVPLSPERQRSTGKYASLHFDASPELLSALVSVGNRLVFSVSQHAEKVDSVFAEAWMQSGWEGGFDSDVDNGIEIERALGPYALPAHISNLLSTKGRRTSVLCATFDPFKLRYGCCMLEAQ